MKKLNLWMAGLLFSLLVVVTVINVNLKFGGVADKDFILTNMEALAQGENGENDCWGSGNVVCGGGLYFAKISR